MNLAHPFKMEAEMLSGPDEVRSLLMDGRDVGWEEKQEVLLYV